MWALPKFWKKISTSNFYFVTRTNFASEGAEGMGKAERGANTQPPHGTSQKTVRLCMLHAMYMSTFNWEFGRLPGIKNWFWGHFFLNVEFHGEFKFHKIRCHLWFFQGEWLKSSECSWKLQVLKKIWISASNSEKILVHLSNDSPISEVKTYWVQAQKSI